MKKATKIFIAVTASVLVIMLVLFLALAFSSSSSSNPHRELIKDTKGYEITDMKVDIVVNDDRSMDITETITLLFKLPSRGFYRDIAVNSGEKVRNVSVENLDYFNNSLYVSHLKSGVLRIRIGSPNVYLSMINQPKVSVIKYKMITPKVKKHPDTVMLNVIGNGWTTYIKNAKINITLPKNINEGEEKYYIGGYGSTDDALAKNRVSVEKKDNKVTLTLLGDSSGKNYVLAPFEGLTLYYGLPKGTFKAYIDYQLFIVLGVMLALTAISVIAKLIFAKNKEVVPITHFYPPKRKRDSKRMSPAEMGYLIDGSCSNNDIAGLIYYFASNGLLQIDQTENDILLIKQEGNLKILSYAEKCFYDKIFADGDEVMSSELSYKLSGETMKVSSEIKKNYPKSFYDKITKNISFALSLLSFAVIFILTFFCYMRIHSSYFNFRGIIGILPVLACNIFGSILVKNWFKYWEKRKIYLGIYIAFAALTVLIMILLLKVDVVGILESLIIGCGTGITVLLLPFISKRTDEYNEILGDIVGFRNFLVTCEKEKLEMLLEENPQYFYDVLPYAQVLGVSKIWQDKFKDITLAPPSYIGSDAFSFYLFMSLYHRSYSSFSRAAMPQPSSSSHSGGGGGFGGFGGGGGGGFSGGGFGGGGGGRF